MAVRAVRGAIQIDHDDRDEVISAVAEMIDAVLSRNAFGADDLISILFTVTPDIRSEFPAYATRKAGIKVKDVTDLVNRLKNEAKAL